MFFLKLALSNLIIITCVTVGRRFPTLGGLIATMPLTSLIVLIWLHTENPGNTQLIGNFTKGVLWGVLPTIAFFATGYICLWKGMGFYSALTAGSILWLAGALLHQWLLR
ncbi:MAG TPA: DUF3147 family protein [Desulfuromonadaceae bacterium]|jgi:F0F1-type ATP synthase assembly protein I